MLCNLHIENIAVARSIDLDFSNGFTVLTGETGAGKSVIVGALSLLCGSRFDRGLLRSGAESASVSAVFCDLSSETREALHAMEIEPDEESCIYLQRTLQSDGKSRCRINGRAVPASVLQEAGSLLLHIHGQHENQRLLRASAHRELLDRYCETLPLLAEYQRVYAERRAVATRIEALRQDTAEQARLLEILEFQIKEIESAKLRVGEQDALIAERDRLRASDRIQKQCKLVMRALFQNDKGISACDMIDRAIPAIVQIQDFVSDSEKIIEQLQSYRSELEDIAQRVADAAGGIDADPQKALDKIEARLSLISKLQRKYGASEEEVLDFCAQSRQRLHDIATSEDRLFELEAVYKKADREAKALALALREKRAEGALTLQRQMKEELAFLDMEKVSFSVRLTPCELKADGCDEVGFFICANAGEEMKPMDRVASGGELSRIMLALKCVLQGKEATDTLIFDEVDTGVSGRTSQRIGVKLRQVASTAQVMCVTHAAQIAATAHHQMRIYKQEIDGRTESAVQLLNEEERVYEIARIMGGAEITDVLLSSAQELRRESERLSN